MWLLPLGVSAVTLGFGILITFDSSPVNWRANFLDGAGGTSAHRDPLRRAHDRTGAPGDRAPGPPGRGNSGRLTDASAVVGGTALVGRAVAVALGFAFAISLGEFGATLFVARGDRPTVPII